MAKKYCPNCASTDYHTSWSHPDPRCNYCGYNSEFPDRKPPIPQPMPRIDVTSPEYQAAVRERIETKGYICCGSKVFNQHERSCQHYDSQYTRRSETWGT